MHIRRHSRARTRREYVARSWPQFEHVQTCYGSLLHCYCWRLLRFLRVDRIQVDEVDAKSLERINGLKSS